MGKKKICGIKDVDCRGNVFKCPYPNPCWKHGK